jgi:hypothetical protein
MAKLEKKDDLQVIMGVLSASAPVITFAVACMAFVLVGIFKADYYEGVLLARWDSWAKAAGIAIAAVTELARATLLLLTFADFRQRNFRGGWLGLFLSLGLVFYDCSGAGAVSSLWTNEHGAHLGAIIRDLIVFLVVLSFGLEFRLVLSKSKADAQEESDTAKNALPVATGAQKSSNGIHA